MTIRTPHEVAEAAVLACLLEVAAPKPGNVTRYHDLPGLTLTDFLASAPALAPAMASAGSQPVGITILAAITATKRRVMTNTNLGIILLLAPLAAAALRSDIGDNVPLRDRVTLVLRNLTVDDAREVYRAIRLANPGGMGEVTDQDITAEPTATLRAVMSLAVERDSIAREYMTDYATTFDVGYPALVRYLQHGHHIAMATVGAYLELLSRIPDSLIEREHGAPRAAEVSSRAAAIQAIGGIETDAGRAAIAEMDVWLRSIQPKLNPGTTADLVTSALFVALLEEIPVLTRPVTVSTVEEHA